MDTLGYDIEPAYLFNVLTNQAKQNTFQLNDLNKAFIDLSTKYDRFNGLFDDVDLKSKNWDQMIDNETLPLRKY